MELSWHTVSKNLLELFAMLLWAIWKEICSWKHSPLHCRNTLSIDWVMPFPEEFRNDRLSLQTQSCSTFVSMHHCWTKPPLGHFMLNVDAGYDEKLGCFGVGVGMVFRDHEGVVRATSVCGIRRPGSALSAELFAILHGLKFAVQLGFVNVLISSDSSSAVQAVTSPLENRDQDGIIIAEISSMLNLPNLI